MRHKLNARYHCVMYRPLALLLVGVFVSFSFSLRAMADDPVVELRQSDFTFGTYIIDKPGRYRLAENISFNPNAYAVLRAQLDGGQAFAQMDRGQSFALPMIEPADASMPLNSQFLYGPGEPFTPGGLSDARYDPAAYGIGFFAAIVITANDVDLDLNGFTIEQSSEHALMQRFFSVIELADQPFIPGQGPSGFGDNISAAERVRIYNGTIGRSAHHGIHGNANVDVEISNIDFVDYEVAAIALNGVDGLKVSNVTATNRKDIPVLGTFSSAMFIKPYIDDLVRSGSKISLRVNGSVFNAIQIQRALRNAINRVYNDVVVLRYQVNGRPSINRYAHPQEYALFHNHRGIVDGNAYGFLVNHIGIAVDGFPTRPDGVTRIPANNIFFNDVHILSQHASINETPAIATNDGTAVVDPVGAVFQVLNKHPDDNTPITVTSDDLTKARYSGNAVANAQAFVAKAALAGDVGSGRLDISRMTIASNIVDWIEGRVGSETLHAVGVTWLCNGDSMFHVNKGAIGFKMDSATTVRLVDTSVKSLRNFGKRGTDLCGDYSDSVSHPKSTLPGYGGAHSRGYTFSGSNDVIVSRASVRNVMASSGPATGIDVLTDSSNVTIVDTSISDLKAGLREHATYAPNYDATSSGLTIAQDATNVSIDNACVSALSGRDGVHRLIDNSYAVAAHRVLLSERCESQPTIKIITTPDRVAPGGYGWAIVNGGKQWVPSDCRTSLEAAGLNLEAQEWSVISLYKDGPVLSCDKLLSLVSPV